MLLKDVGDKHAKACELSIMNFKSHSYEVLLNNISSISYPEKLMHLLKIHEYGSISV